MTISETIQSYRYIWSGKNSLQFVNDLNLLESFAVKHFTMMERDGIKAMNICNTRDEGWNFQIFFEVPREYGK